MHPRTCAWDAYHDRVALAGDRRNKAKFVSRRDLPSPARSAGFVDKLKNNPAESVSAGLLCSAVHKGTALMPKSLSALAAVCSSRESTLMPRISAMRAAVWAMRVESHRFPRQGTGAI